MSTQDTAGSKNRNRMSRQASKEIPSRRASRLYSAKADIKNSCEQTLTRVRNSRLTPAEKATFQHAVGQVLGKLNTLDTGTPRATGAVRSLAKEADVLSRAEQWVSKAQRLTLKLMAAGQGTDSAKLAEAIEEVLWCVRAGSLNGQLTAALATLGEKTKQADTLAARLP